MTHSDARRCRETLERILAEAKTEHADALSKLQKHCPHKWAYVQELRCTTCDKVLSEPTAL